MVPWNCRNPVGLETLLAVFIGIQKEVLGREIERLTADYSNITCREEVGLCHGNLGNIMIGELTEMNVWEDSMRKNMMESLWVLQKLFVENETKAVLREHYDYSLMTGLAGVGYGLLRSLFPNLPGILDLQL